VFKAENLANSKECGIPQLDSATTFSPLHWHLGSFPIRLEQADLEKAPI